MTATLVSVVTVVLCTLLSGISATLTVLKQPLNPCTISQNATFTFKTTNNISIYILFDDKISEYYQTLSGYSHSVTKFFSDGQHNCSVFECSTLGSNCSKTATYYYTWLQLTTPPTTKIQCPANFNSSTTSESSKEVEFQSICPSLTNSICPSNMIFDYWCSNQDDAIKPISKTCTLGRCVCAISDNETSSGKWNVHAFAHLRNSQLVDDEGATCSFNYTYFAPTSQTTPSSSSSNIPAIPQSTPSPSAVEPTGLTPSPGGGWKVYDGPKSLDIRTGDKKFDYTFSLLRVDLNAPPKYTAGLECCIQYSLESDCNFINCGNQYPNITYHNLDIPDGYHTFKLRGSGTDVKYGILASYSFRTLRSSRPNPPALVKSSIASGSKTSSKSISIHMKHVPSNDILEDLNITGLVLQYRFSNTAQISNSVKWVTKLHFKSIQSTLETINIVSDDISIGYHVLQVRTVITDMIFANEIYHFDPNGNNDHKNNDPNQLLFSKPYVFDWTRINGVHTNLDYPVGIDHDCSNSNNPFFGGGSNVCAGHVYSSPSMLLKFHSVGETGCLFIIHHYGPTGVTILTPDTKPKPCTVGVDVSTSTCSSLTLSNLKDGFHSISLQSNCSNDVNENSIAKTYANFTIDTILPTCTIDLSSHPVKGCIDGDEKSGNCVTHLSEANFGATSNENSVFFYALDPLVKGQPSENEWKVAPKQINPRVPRHPACHSSFKECYGAGKAIHGIKLENLSNGMHSIYIRATDEAGHNSGLSSYSWTYVPGDGHPGICDDVQVIKTRDGTSSLVPSFKLPVVVKWKTPLNNGGSPVVSYTLKLTPNSPARVVDDKGFSGSITIKDITKTDTTVYVEEGINYKYQIIAFNKFGGGPTSLPFNYVRKDLNDPCSSIDCSNRGSCERSNNNARCVCLPFNKDNPSNAYNPLLSNVHCDMSMLDDSIQTTSIQINAISGFDGNCTESCNVSATTPGVENRNPSSCFQVFEKQSTGKWVYNYQVKDTTNSKCGANGNVQDTINEWEKKIMNNVNSQKVCNNKGETCGSNYLTVSMDIVDGDLTMNHISLMLAISRSRVTFEKDLQNEIHLWINHLNKDQIYVDNIIYKSGGSAIDRATVTFRIMPNVGGLSIENTKKVMITTAATATEGKINLASSRWLSTVDPKTFIVKEKKIQGLPPRKKPSSIKPELPSILPEWFWYAISAGVAFAVCICAVIIWCMCKEKNPQGGSSGKSVHMGSDIPSRYRKSSRGKKVYNQVQDDDDEDIDLLTGDSMSSNSVTIEMGYTNRKGDNIFGL
jgi:hypothetical protein